MGDNLDNKMNAKVIMVDDNVYSITIFKGIYPIYFYKKYFKEIDYMINELYNIYKVKEEDIEIMELKR